MTGPRPLCRFYEHVLTSKFSLDTVWAAVGVVDERIKQPRVRRSGSDGIPRAPKRIGTYRVCVMDGRRGKHQPINDRGAHERKDQNVLCTGIERDGEGDRENQSDDRLGKKGECANSAGFGRHVRFLLRLCCF